MITANDEKLSLHGRSMDGSLSNHFGDGIYKKSPLWLAGRRLKARENYCVKVSRENYLLKTSACGLINLLVRAAVTPSLARL
jgi:hypothetical protein